MKHLSHMKDYIAIVIFIIVNMMLSVEEPIHASGFEIWTDDVSSYLSISL